MQGEHPLLVVGLVVVELEGLPWCHADVLAHLLVSRAVARRLERLNCDLVVHYVVGVWITTVLIISDHDLWLELPHQPDQRPGRVGNGRTGETALRQGWERVALGQPGIEKTQPDLSDAEDPPGLFHLGPA